MVEKYIAFGERDKQTTPTDGIMITVMAEFGPNATLQDVFQAIEALGGVSGDLKIIPLLPTPTKEEK